MSDLRVGLIGCGGHAQSHLRMIQDEPRMALVAIAELDEQRLGQAKETFNPEFAFSDYRQMLETVDLDVVYVVTAPAHHLPIVLACLEHNLHTSVEKPAGMTSEETRQMLEAAKQSTGKVIFSVNRRYKPEILAIRKALQDRGGAVQAAANYHKPPVLPNLNLRPADIVADAIHHVDLLAWMAGRTLTEAARATEILADSWHGPREGCARYNAMITFENGCRGVMMSHYGVGYRIQSIEVHAEDMSAYIDLTRNPEIALYLDGQRVETPLENIVDPNFNETQHFADCILNDTEPWSTLEDAVQTMALCEAIERGHRGAL